MQISFTSHVRALRHDAGFTLFPFLVIKAKILLNFYDMTEMEKKHEIFTNLKLLSKENKFIVSSNFLGVRE